MHFTNYIKKLPVTKGGWKERPLEGVTDITIHHSGEDAKYGPLNFANYHTLPVAKKGKGWPAIAYHFVIMADGEIRQCLKMASYSSHNGFNNKAAIAICLCGNFEVTEPTAAQYEALSDMIELLKERIPSVRYLNGHREYPRKIGRTLCPGKNLSVEPLRIKHGLASNPRADIIH